MHSHSHSVKFDHVPEHRHDHDNHHSHDHNNDHEDFMMYESFSTGEKRHFYNIVSYDKKDMWRSLTMEKAQELIRNKDQYGLNDDQVKSLLIYSVMSYCVNNMIHPETMYIAEVITYELKKAGYIK